MKNIILASQSPRRKELLALAGYDFQVITSNVDEVITMEKPDEIAKSLSSQKAEDVFNIIMDRYGNNHIEDYVVIGADTVVSVDGELLGKPKNKEDAVRMIRLIQGRKHQVFTGVTLVSMAEGKPVSISFHECTEVDVYPMADEEIVSYVNCESVLKTNSDLQTEVHYDWADKAGGYGIQGTFARYIKGIVGDYYNVVGLPIAHLHQELKNIV